MSRPRFNVLRLAARHCSGLQGALGRRQSPLARGGRWRVTLGYPKSVFRSCAPEVLQTVRVRDMWIADRNFCTRDLLCTLDGREAFFLIRQPGSLPFGMLSSLRPGGRIETGQPAEQRVRVVDTQGTGHVFRRLRITLKEANRDGSKLLYILTKQLKYP